MFKRLRQHRSLRTALATVLMLAWLVALTAGVQARAAGLQALPPDVCSVATGGSAEPGHSGGTPADHAGRHDPDCLLCVALATPPTPLWEAAPTPVPTAHVLPRSTPLAVGVWRARAPMPARGPPAPLHV